MSDIVSPDRVPPGWLLLTPGFTSGYGPKLVQISRIWRCRPDPVSGGSMVFFSGHDEGRAVVKETISELADMIRQDIERRTRMRRMLVRAMNQFRFYEQQHRAKNTADGDAKAQVNREFVEAIEAVLAETAA